MYKYKRLQVGQLPWEHLSSLQNLLNFFVTRYLKQEVDEDLVFAWMNVAPVASLWLLRYQDLSMSHDQKVMTLSPMEKCSMDFYQGVDFYCPNLITVAPL